MDEFMFLVIFIHVCNFISHFLLRMEVFSVKRVAGGGNCFFLGLAMLLRTVSYYFVFR
jgi:hypothetical protein